MDSDELQAAFAPEDEAESKSLYDVEPQSKWSSQKLTSYDRVREFHEAFGAPVADNPTTIEHTRATLRLALILEESLELAEAMGFRVDEVYTYVNRMLARGPVFTPEIVPIADALADLDYVVNGAALEHGINLPVVTAEVHRSNMTKLGADGKPVYREDGKVLKGPNYSEPDIEAVL